MYRVDPIMDLLNSSGPQLLMLRPNSLSGLPYSFYNLRSSDGDLGSVQLPYQRIPTCLEQCEAQKSTIATISDAWRIGSEARNSLINALVDVRLVSLFVMHKPL